LSRSQQDFFLPGVIGGLDVDHDDGHEGEEYGHYQGQSDGSIISFTNLNNLIIILTIQQCCGYDPDPVFSLISDPDRI
jgi:hypothetical protein